MVTAVARIWSITLVLLALLGCDFVAFIMRRHRVLARYNAGQPRLSTADDFRAVDDAYTQRGEKPPTMTDFEKAAGFAFVPEWRTALRYREVGRFYAAGLLVDIGCGDGRLCWHYHACPPQNYYGVDATGLVAILREKTNDVAHALAGTAEATTLPDHHADLVVCSECFEHLTEPGLALREFCRILKPAGRIVIQSPSARRLRNLNPLHLIATYLGRWFPGFFCLPWFTKILLWMRTRIIGTSRARTLKPSFLIYRSQLKRCMVPCIASTPMETCCIAWRIVSPDGPLSTGCGGT